MRNGDVRATALLAITTELAALRASATDVAEGAVAIPVERLHAVHEMLRDLAGAPTVLPSVAPAQALAEVLADSLHHPADHDGADQP